jgi:cell division protein FtsB
MSTSSHADNLERMQERLADASIHLCIVDEEAIDAAAAELRRLEEENAALRGESDLYHRGYDAMGAADISEYLALCKSVRQVEAENAQLRLRLLSAAGDDLCRLSQEEIKAYTSGKVQIPPKEEFLPSCERFHAQIANEAGVLEGCLTLAQLIAENAKLDAENARLKAATLTDEERELVQSALRCLAMETQDTSQELAAEALLAKLTTSSSASPTLPNV